MNKSIMIEVHEQKAVEKVGRIFMLMSEDIHPTVFIHPPKVICEHLSVAVMGLSHCEKATENGLMPSTIIIVHFITAQTPNSLNII